ncbi:polymorphic toxin-type HINT domain-containing protein [Myceligenerans xiligouense]|uniref:polymorphic toxin-type HINT domain-containing protein n=1 Tax=Myceligenerans xiligouense TaxID=253184 RepID=UPI000F4F4957|nr:polymorphic toxin-type HINT domain-containing protein [Myceligenerans xiligouense]
MASRTASGLGAVMARTARRGKPAGVGLVAAAVAVTLGVQPVLAVPAAAGVECVTVSDDQATALKVAHACKLEVEVRSERTSWTTVYATPSGTMRVESTALAERALVDGAWLPVDSRVVSGDTGDGRLEVAVSPNELTFSDGTAGQSLASMVRDGHELILDAPFDLTEPVVDGDQVTYPDVVTNGVDLVVSVNPDATGFTETLVFASREAAERAEKKVGLDALTFPLTTSTGLQVTRQEGGLVATDMFGQEIFTAPAPRAWDSTSRDLTGTDDTARSSWRLPAQEEVTPLRARGPSGWEHLAGDGVDPADLSVHARSALPGDRSTGIGVDLVPAAPRHQDTAAAEEVAGGIGTAGVLGGTTAGGQPSPTGGLTVGGAPAAGDPGVAGGAGAEGERSTVGVRLELDTDWLFDDATKFPVYADPAFSGSPNAWLMVHEPAGGETAQYMFDGDEGLGLCDVDVAAGCVADSRFRLGWRFDGLDQIGLMDASRITSAQFSASGEHSWDCNPRGVQLWRTSPFDAASDWASWGASAFVEELDEQVVSHKTACDNVKTVTWDATAAAKRLAEVDGGSVSLGLRATNEQDMTLGWKRYHHAASLTIEYEPELDNGGEGQDLAARSDNLAPVIDDADTPDTAAPAEITPEPRSEEQPPDPAAPVEELPAGGVAEIPVTTEPTQVDVGGLDLTVAAPAEGEAPDQVVVDVADQASTEADGVTGVVLEVTDSTPAGTAAAGETRAVEATVDYGEFTEAAGADWGRRLQVMRIPACAEATPEAPECQPELVETSNDENAQTLTATLEIPAAGAETVEQVASSGSDEQTKAGELSTESESTSANAVQAEQTMTAADAETGDKFAVTSGTSSASGDWAATPINPTGEWSVSGATGAMGWTYPVTVPSPAAGPAPQLAIGYSSSSLVGRVSGANNQSSWIGDGWDLTTGFIERSYVPCVADQDADGGDTPNNATRDTADLCWDGENAVMSLGGKTTKLVKNTSASSSTKAIWVPEADDGTLVEQILPGGPNATDRGSKEYWRVVTVDGSVHTFGRDNRFEGDSLDQDSRWTVPVYGNHAGEPGHATAFADSERVQAWRFNLDHVTDTLGNTMSYTYSAETNRYAADVGRDGDKTYTRGGTLKRIEYGTRTGEAGHANAPYRVEFDVAERCFGGSAECPTTTKPTRSEMKRWRDTPMDLICVSGDDCESYAPAFFSRKRLTGITTQARIDGAYRDIDTYGLQQKFRDPGDGTGKLLWLQSITRTPGGDPDAAAVDPLKTWFAGETMPARVDHENLTDGLPAMNRFHVTDIVNETGGMVSISYKDSDCTPANTQDTSLAAQEANTKNCFPVRWHVAGEDEAHTEWFHSYLVSSVTQTAGGVRSGGVSGHGDPDQVTYYDYKGDAGWARLDNPRLDEPVDRTWSDFRGYAQVVIRQGEDGPSARTRYLRGLGGTITATAGDVSRQVDDHEHLAGMVVVAKALNGTDGSGDERVLSETVTDPVVVEGITYDGLTTARTKSMTTVSALLGANGVVDHTTRTSKTMDEYGNTTQVNNEGDLEVGNDQTCTRSDYHDPGTTHITGALKQTITRAGSCDTQDDGTPGKLISATRVSYDQQAYGQAPTDALLTGTRSIDPERDPQVGTTFEAVGWSTSDLYTTTTFDVHEPGSYPGALGRPVAVTDAAGRITRTDYALAGGILTQTTSRTPDPDGTGPLTAHTATTTLSKYRGVPTKVTDANGRVTTAEYDRAGRLTRVWLPERQGKSASLRYEYTISPSGINAITTRTLRADGATYQKATSLFDGLGRDIQTQTESVDAADPGRIITDIQYDEAGRVYQVQGPWFEPDTSPGTTIVGTDDVPEATTRMVYDDAGRTTAEIFFDNNPDNPDYERWRTRTVFDGATTLVIPPAGAVPTSTTADAHGRTTALTQYVREYGDPGADAYPDTAGEVRDLPAQTTTYEYDHAGRMVEVVDPAGNAWTYEHDLAGRQTRTVDPDRGVTSTTYDVAGQPVTVTDANGTLAYTYDALGRVTSLRDDSPSGPLRAAWTYDKYAHGPNAGQTIKGMTTAATRYTPDGTGDSDTDADEYVTAVTEVDAAYRTIASQVILPEGNADLALLGSSAEDRTFETRYSYVADGQVESVTYQGVGNLKRETVTTGYTATGMPEWMAGGFGWGTYVAEARFNAYGELLYQDLGNTYGTVVSYQYEPGTRRLEQVSLDRERISGKDLNLKYAYDQAGNILSAKDVPTHEGMAADRQCYTYDGLNRLTEAWTPDSGDCSEAPSVEGLNNGVAPYWESFEYDSLGNRTSHTLRTPDGSDPDGGTSGGEEVVGDYIVPGGAGGGGEPAAGDCTADAEGPHQVAAVSTQAATGSACQTLTYDGAGNTTSRTTVSDFTDVVQDLTWDVEGELVDVATATTVYEEPVDEGSDETGDGGSTAGERGAGTTTTSNVSMVYTADGDRVLRNQDGVVTLYVGGGQEVALDTAAGTVTATRYYAFAGQTVAVRTDRGMGGVTSLINDPHGTPLASVHNTALPTQGITKHHTLPFGDARGDGAAPPGDHRFLGAPQDATGLVMLGARYYDPTTGRFLSVDPIMDLTSPQQWNAYSYGNNNPNSYTDPDGLEPRPWHDPGTPMPDPGDVTERDDDGAPRTGGGGGTSAPPIEVEDGVSEIIPVDSDGRADLSAYDAKVELGQINELMPWYLTTAGWFDVMVTDSLNFWIDTARAIDDPRLFTEFWGSVEAWERELDLELKMMALGVATGGVGLALKAAAKGGTKITKTVMKGACSFAGATLILMADGSHKPIEDIEPGDEVIATDPETGEQGAREVTHVWVHQDDLFEFEVDGELIVTTEDHPFWSVTDQAWEGTQNLERGDQVLTASGRTAAVTREVDPETRETNAAYNLTVADLHTYYVLAGATPVLVHNSNCGGRWKLGEDYSKLNKNGVAPSLSTMRKRFWKNEAAEVGAADQYGASNVARMKRGSAPQRQRPDGSWESMELSHEPIPERDGGMVLTPRWPEDHVIMDPGGYRRLPPDY